MSTTSSPWLASGSKIEFTVTSPKLSAESRVRMCFRWKVEGGDPGPWHEASSIGILERQGNSAKIAAVVPTMPRPPLPPWAAKKDEPRGVYAINESMPIADVRVLVSDATGSVLVDGMSSVGIISEMIQCNVPGPQTSADLGSATLSDHKNWQPRGGEVEFTVKATKVSIPQNAPIRVCFRWKVVPEADPGDYHSGGPVRILDRQTDTIRLAVTIPDLLSPSTRPDSATKQKNSDPRVYAFGFVPQADVRLLVFSPEGTLIVDVWSVVGITYIPIALGTAGLLAIIAFIILWRICCHRLPHLRTCNPVLCVIATRSGYASLSQFQIILWTFLVAVSAIYVMALAGDLIEITTGTLVLLGISGGTTVASKLKSESDDVAADPPPPPGPAAAATAVVAAQNAAKAARDAVAKANNRNRVRLQALAEALAAEADAKTNAADAITDADNAARAAVTATASGAANAKNLADEAKAKAMIAASLWAKADALSLRKPRWSDLVVEGSQGREIDVSRVQMLYFTLITATFVLMQVLRTYSIPVIPEGFLILMGISNGVYMGSKYAKPKAQ